MSDNNVWGDSGVSDEGLGSSPSKKTPGIVIAAFVLSLVGICGITAVIGIVLGFIGRKAAKKSGSGVGLATAAIVIGAVWLGLMIFGLILGGTNSDTQSSGGSTKATANSSAPADLPEPTPPDSSTTETVPAPVEANWYPKGYTEYEDGLAWKWTDESCGYSDAYCWTMRVKSRDGCVDGLYAEVNLEKKGVVVDYTNDLLGSLAPGATAKLEFVHFGDDGTLSASLTQLSCHNY